MDAGRLIQEVKKRRLLWDLERKKKADKNLILQLWEEISEELGFPTHELKKKWANLRHSYRLALKNQWITWQYLDQMSFIDDFMAPDPLCEEQAEPSQFDDENCEATISENFEYLISPNNSERNCDLSNDMNDVEFGKYIATENSEHNEPPPTKRIKRQFPDMKKESTRKKIELEGKKLDLSSLRKPSKDSIEGDYHFLMSFLPSMNEMTYMEKLEFRAQMSNISLNIMRSRHVTEDIDFNAASTSRSVRRIPKRESRNK